MLQREVTEALALADSYAYGMNAVRVPEPEVIDEPPALEAAETV